MIEMIKEVKEFSNIVHEVPDLVHYFIRLVVDTKHNMEVIAPSSDKPLETRDKEDIEIALKGMSLGISRLLKLARTSRKESILKRKIVVEGRLKILECAPWLRTIEVSATRGYLRGSAALAAIHANLLGDLGVLFIGGMSFPTVYANIIAAVIGRVFLSGMVYLV